MVHFGTGHPVYSSGARKLVMKNVVTQHTPDIYDTIIVTISADWEKPVFLANTEDTEDS